VDVLRAFCKCKSPTAESVIRVMIRRCEKAFYTDAVINDSGKILKLAAMHLLAAKLMQTLCDPRFLGHAVRNGNNDLICLFIDLISNNYGPGEEFLRLHKTA
jgi:hypothetical protein